MLPGSKGINLFDLFINGSFTIPNIVREFFLKTLNESTQYAVHVFPYPVVV